MLLAITHLRLKVLAAMPNELDLGYVLLSSLLGMGEEGAPSSPAGAS